MEHIDPSIGKAAVDPKDPALHARLHEAQSVMAQVISTQGAALIALRGSHPESACDEVNKSEPSALSLLDQLNEQARVALGQARELSETI